MFDDQLLRKMTEIWFWLVLVGRNKMDDVVKQFVDCVSGKDELQGKYLQRWEATDLEKKELEIILRFFMSEDCYNMDFIVDAYLFINNMVREETYYFIRNGKYRYSSFLEVDKIVYDNSEYMQKYMLGLIISDYIWINHIKMLRYFEENIENFVGGRYLEIGPGYGQYLVKALSDSKFNEYCACDISKTSVDGCNKYLKYRGLADKCTVMQRDFFDFTSNEKFDCAVMGEVLEHVENPLLMLRKINELLREEGTAFISTVINAPMIDHIFLFSSIEQVTNMVKKAGFKLVDYICCAEGNIPIEKAIRRKQAINIAVILKKG